MQRQKLTLPDDGPLVVRLDFGPEGVEYPSKFGKGTEYMYTCNDDSCILYLKPEARTQVIRSGAQAGDEIAITKVRNGNRVDYRVQVMADAQEPAQPAAAPPRPTRPAAAAATHRGAPAPARAASGPQTVSPIMGRCLAMAAVAVKESLDMMQSLGLELEGGITYEDVRTIAITLYIDERARR